MHRPEDLVRAVTGLTEARNELDEFLSGEAWNVHLFGHSSILTPGSDASELACLTKNLPYG